ncbi:MAG TPA: hypothetical protein VG076_00620 [Acidimicrobiales bacterium]|jgi:hypothetical protein|nr:hypothetical protein [Acidimicrobiales bacterium]
MVRSTLRGRTQRVLLAATLIGAALGGAVLRGPAAHASSFTFSTTPPDGRMAMASRPIGASPNGETEAADDFILTSPTVLTNATFTGLLPAGDPLADVQQVVVEIYRVFPDDSNVGRTSGPPTFSTNLVPTRVNSPSDVEFTDRDSTGGSLSFTTSLLAAGFGTANSVNVGIHPKPAQTTGGEGPVGGEEVLFTVGFTNPVSLPTGHYFFVPQVRIGNPTQPFYWLSAAGPRLFAGDLQTWMRNPSIEPDWLRVGTDIVASGQTFNASFTLSGQSDVTTVSGSVPGSFTPPAGTAVDIENATIGGSVNLSGSSFVRICNSTINGNLNVSGSSGFVLIGDGGDEGGFCHGNHVSGTVYLANNGHGVELGGTSTGGNVILSSNSGGSGEDATPEVEANHVGGSLSCFGNSPAPINDSRPNTVSGARNGPGCGTSNF